MSNLMIVFVDNLSNKARMGQFILKKFARETGTNPMDVEIDEMVIANVEAEWQDENGNSSLYTPYTISVLLASDDYKLLHAAEVYVYYLKNTLNIDTELDDRDQEAREKAVEYSKAIEADFKRVFGESIQLESGDEQNHLISMDKYFIFNVTEQEMKRASLAYELSAV